MASPHNTLTPTLPENNPQLCFDEIKNSTGGNAIESFSFSPYGTGTDSNDNYVPHFRAAPFPNHPSAAQGPRKSGHTQLLKALCLCWRQGTTPE